MSFFPYRYLAASCGVVHLHDQGIVRVRAENILKSAPPNAIVFANWGDITPLVYLQKVEGERPDIRLYNLFLINVDDLITFTRTLDRQHATVWAIGEAASGLFKDSNLSIEEALALKTDTDVTHIFQITATSSGNKPP